MEGNFNRGLELVDDLLNTFDRSSANAVLGVALYWLSVRGQAQTQPQLGAWGSRMAELVRIAARIDNILDHVYEPWLAERIRREQKLIARCHADPAYAKRTSRRRRAGSLRVVAAV